MVSTRQRSPLTDDDSAARGLLVSVFLLLRVRRQGPTIGVRYMNYIIQLFNTNTITSIYSALRKDLA